MHPYCVLCKSYAHTTDEHVLAHEQNRLPPTTTATLEADFFALSFAQQREHGTAEVFEVCGLTPYEAATAERLLGSCAAIL